VFNWIKNLFGAQEQKPTKLSDHVPEKKKPTVKAPTKAELKKLTKSALEAKGRDYGLELDKRLTKDKLVDQLFKHIKSL